MAEHPFPPPRRLRWQVLATGGSEAASRLVQLATLALSGHTLGASGVAHVALGQAFALMAQAIVQNGPELAGTRRLAIASQNTGLDAGLDTGPDAGQQEERQDRQQAAASSSPSSPAVTAAICHEIFATGQLKLLFALLLAPLVLLSCLVLLPSGFPAGPSLADSWRPGGSGLQVMAQYLAMTLMSASHLWVFRASGQAGSQALLRLLQVAGTLGGLAVILAFYPSPLAVPLAEGAAALLLWSAGRWQLRRWYRPGKASRCQAGGLPASVRRFPARQELWQRSQEALSLGLAGLLSGLCWQAPLLLAARWIALEQVGELAVALRLLLGANSVLQILYQAFYPTLARLYALQRQAGSAAVTVLAAYGGLLPLPVLALLMAFSGPIVRGIAGPSLDPAGPLLAALLPALIPVALSSPLSYGLMACGKGRTVLTLQGGAAVATVAACALAFALYPAARAVLVLHPLLWGQLLVTIVLARNAGILMRPPAGWRATLHPQQPARVMAGTATPSPAEETAALRRRSTPGYPGPGEGEG